MTRTAVAGVALAVLFVATSADAQSRPCGCYCGEWLPEPCSDEACKQACGWVDPPTASPTDQEAAEDARRRNQMREEPGRERKAAERQREADLQKRTEAEAAQRWERKKQDILAGMKGIVEGEPGLKDPPSAPVSDDVSVVDLRDLGLEPDGPMSVDPNVVRGKERVFPAQPDPATFRNVAYNRGFEALRSFDPVAAVPLFEQAWRERSGDPLVHNALLLAQDLLRVQEKKRSRAVQLMVQTYVALAAGSLDEALSSVTAARALDPKNREAIALAIVTERLAKEHAHFASPEEGAAYKMVGHAVAYSARHNEPMVLTLLEGAHDLAPADPLIRRLLEQACEPGVVPR